MSSFRIAAAAALFISAAALGQPAPAPSPDPAPRPTAPTDINVTKDEARQTATDLARKLEDNYVFPDIAQRYAAMLRANAASGAYDGITSGHALADRLTGDLRAISPDAHLRVRVGPAMRPPPPGAQKPAAAQMHPVFPWKPIEEARWLAPGIAYIRFNVFPGDPETVAAVRQFMIDHATAKVIIFDNRTHHGGGLDEMNAMFPYLFSKPATLLTMDTRASVDRSRGSPVGDDDVRVVPGPAGVVRREHYVVPSKTEKRLFNAKVFVLISGATGSAAEHMTLALKHTHRATIIGEPTAGADHFGEEEAIGDKFSAFIPVGRSSDPDTGKDWEGVGIEPDVEVPAEQALTKALALSGLSQTEAERISATVKPSLPMTRRIPRVLPPGGHGI